MQGCLQATGAPRCVWYEQSSCACSRPLLLVHVARGVVFSARHSQCADVCRIQGALADAQGAVPARHLRGHNVVEVIGAEEDEGVLRIHRGEDDVCKSLARPVHGR